MSLGSTRGRLFAITFLALLVTSAFPGVVPSAAAATGSIDAENANLVVLVNGAPPSAFVKAGDTVRVEAHWNATRTVNPIGGECLDKQAAIAVVDMSPFTNATKDGYDQMKDVEAHALAGAAGTDTGTTTMTTPYDFVRDFVVDPETSNGTDSGSIELYVVMQLLKGTPQTACKNDSDPVAILAATLNLDNRRPGGVITIQPQWAAGRTLPIIGDKIWVNATPGAGATSAVADLRAIGLSATTSIPFANNAFTIIENGGGDPPTPTAMILDTHNNHIDASLAGALDAHASSIPSIVAASQVGGSVLVTTRRVIETDNRSNDIGYNWSVSSPGRPTKFYQPNSSDASKSIVPGGDEEFLTFVVPRADLRVESPPITHTIEAWATDNSGNVGPKATTTIAPADAPSALTIGSHASVGNVWPSFGGTWTTSTALANGEATTMKFYVQNAAGNYWDGTEAASNFVATKTLFPIALTTSNGAADHTGTFAFSPTQVHLNASTYKIPNATYTIGVEFDIGSNDPGSAIVPFSFHYDWQKPAVTGTASDNKVTSLKADGGTQQGRPLTMRIDVRDDGAEAGRSGINRNGAFTFTLVNGTTGSSKAPARDLATGAPLSVTCSLAVTSPNCISFVANMTPFPDGIMRANATVLFDTPALGPYLVNVTFSDLAGNSLTTTLAGNVYVQPRVVFGQALEAPYGNASGLAFRVYAAYDNLSSYDPPVPSCPNRTCRVTTVEVYARNATAPDSSALGSASAPLIHHSEQPLDTTPTARVPGDAKLYYDFSKTGHALVAIPAPLDASNMYIKALVRTQVGPGLANFTNVTDWIRVQSGEAPSDLSLSPIDNSTVNMSGQKGSIAFNATFEQGGLDFVPRVNYTLRLVRDANGPVTAPSYVRFETTTLSRSNEASWIDVPASKVGTSAPTGPRYYFNWSNNATLPPGEYILNASVRGPDVAVGNASVLKSVERMVSVEDTPPVVHLDDASLHFAQPEIFQGRYVPLNFNVSFLVDHGFANLTASKINLTLRASNTAPGATGTRVVRSGSEGFLATIRDLNFNPENRSTYGNFSVKLPDSATDGIRYDLIVTVTTDSANSGGGALATATDSRLIDVDLSPPNLGIYHDASVATGQSLASPLRVIGFAVDASSGVRAVEARVVNANSSMTYNPLANFGQGAWVSADQEVWLTSDALNTNDDEYVRSIELVTLSNGTSEWQIHDSAAYRSVIRFANVDHVTGSPVLGFGRTYELTFNNLSGPAGSTWYLFAPSGAVRAIASSIVDTPRGMTNVTFRNVSLTESGTWKANISSSGANPTTFSVAAASFTVDDSKAHTETVLRAVTTVNDVSGLLVSGVPFSGSIESLNGSVSSVWNLYAPTGLGRGESFATTPTLTATAVADSAHPGKVKVTLSSFTFDKGGVWRLNESNKNGDSNATFFNVPRGSYGALGLDRNNTYTITARAADKISGFGSSISDSVPFDITPPVVDVALAGPGALLNWHDTRSFTVNAIDNNCVAAVNLIVRTPANVTLSPLPFLGPYNATGALFSATTCVPTSSQWRFPLATNPQATGEVGNYTYAVEVVDSAGIAKRDPRTINATVQDTQSPVLQFIYSEPPVAQIGSSITLRLRYFENYAMNQVVVNLTKRDNLNQIIQTFHEVAAKPDADVAANGTGNYSASTSLDFGIENLTEGTYQWVVHAKDTNSLVTCISPGCPPAVWITRVTSDAPAFIAVDSPSSTTTVVNATPTFVWRVLDNTVTASGIQVQAGATNTTRVTVTPLIEALPRVANQSTGYRVTYSPPTINASTYSVLITAAASVPVSRAQDYEVDSIAPNLTAELTGERVIDNRTFTVAGTRVALSATDNESSIASLGYTVNGGSPQTYTVPIAPQGPDGAWRLDYSARDAAGNTKAGTLSLLIDTSGPAIRVAKHGDEVILTVTDAGVGLDDANVTVYYAYGNATTFSTAKLSTVTANSFRALLPGNSTETGLRYYFDAKDKLGNIGTNFSAAAPYVILPLERPENNPPTLSITSPLPNTKVRNSVALNWIAVDPEGDPVSITIAIRDPTGSGDFLVRGGENSGGYIVDVTTKASGSYTLVVTASDGANSAQQSVLFTVERGLPVQCVTCPGSSVEANRQVTIGVQVNPVGKTVAKVAYNVTRDGAGLVTGDMKLAQGVWTATIVPTETGNYKVFITPSYSDGTSDAPREITAFAVTAPAPVVGPMTFPASLILLLVLGVLTVALASYGAFVRWR